MANLLEWYNFIFALPLIVGLLLSLGMAFTGIASDQGGSSDHAGDHAGDPDHSGDHPASPLGQIGGFFGFGRGVSLTLLGPVLLVTWGLVGLVANAVLANALAAPLFFPISALLGLLIAGVAGQGVARLVGRLFANTKSAIKTGELVGRGGRSAFRVTATGGAANVWDKFGNVHRVLCRTLPGEPELEADREILVVDYDPKQGFYYVQAHPFPQKVSS